MHHFPSDKKMPPWPEAKADIASYLSRRFRADVCLDCGRGAAEHRVEINRWGDAVVRCP